MHRGERWEGGVVPRRCPVAGGADGWDCGLLGASWAQSVACRKEVTWVKVDQVVAVGTDGQMWAQDPIGTISGTCSRRTDRRWEQTGFRQQVQQDRQTSDGLNSPPGSGSTDRQMDVGLVVGRCKNPLESHRKPAPWPWGSLGCPGSPHHSSTLVVVHHSRRDPCCLSALWIEPGRFALGFAAVFLLISSLQQVRESMKTGY